MNKFDDRFKNRNITKTLLGERKYCDCRNTTFEEWDANGKQIGKTNYNCRCDDVSSCYMNHGLGCPTVRQYKYLVVNLDTKETTIEYTNKLIEDNHGISFTLD